MRGSALFRSAETARRRLAALGLAGALAVLLSFPVDSLGAVERVNYRAESPDGPRTFFDHGGLLLRGTCEESQTLNVEARTKHSNAWLSYNAQELNGDPSYDENTDFDTGDSEDLFAALGDGGDSTAGQIVYARPGGKIVTIDWAGETEANGIHGMRDCGFFGAARVVESGAADRINFRADAGDGPTTVLSRGGLTLTAECDGSEELNVEANSSVDDAMLHGNEQGDGTDHAADHTDDFDENDPIPDLLLLDAGDGIAGQLVYARPDGKVVTVDYTAHDEASLFGTGKECAFVGTARVRDPGDPKLLDYATSMAFGVSPFNTGGLELKAACPDSELITRIRSHEDNAIIHANSQSPFDDPRYGEDDFAEDDPGDEHPLFGEFNEPYFETNNAEGASGQLIFAAPNGTYVTIDWLTEEDGEPFDGQEDCAWLGTAEVVSP